MNYYIQCVSTSVSPGAVGSLLGGPQSVGHELPSVVECHVVAIRHHLDVRLATHASCDLHWLQSERGRLCYHYQGKSYRQLHNNLQVA